MKKTKGIIFLQRAIDTDGVVALNFIEQFNEMEKNASEIEIRINCSGGSVIHGWSIVDIIQNSKVPVTGIVTGVAASMASVIFAACKKRIMLGYASLMMHNPRNGDPQHVEASTEQLIKFYESNFSISRQAIVNLMNGAKGGDGTWLDADTAISLNLIHGIQQVGAVHPVKNPFKDLYKSDQEPPASNNLAVAMMDIYDTMEIGTIEGAMAKINLMQNLMQPKITALTISGALQQIEKIQNTNRR